MIRHMITAIIILFYFAAFACLCFGAVYAAYLVSNAFMSMNP